MSADIEKEIISLQKAMDTAPVKLYANGFANLLGSSDIIVLLKHNDRVISSVNLSYSTAKSLAEKLGAIVEKLESKTGNKIMTVDEIAPAISIPDDE